MILYDVWQMVNLTLRSEECQAAATSEKVVKGYNVTMPFMLTTFFAHLTGGI
jgi:hypothetical protein